eukprot:NODE_1083_length_1246_cov_101.094878.p1 GENE.NODE_1083_length_1246_cov_101.094878~~NODE_1083_length_1246_cov_101.094878.p1  ORF type:complete len:330 (-),score=12.91 NODE_1083_length_1246_cov_101.094878:150-1139(-)
MAMPILFVALATHVFDRIIVLCYNQSCNQHYPGGGAWPEHVQHRIVVQDGFTVDSENADLLDKITIEGEHGKNVWVSHMVAVEKASGMNITSVLIMEDDVVPCVGNKHLGDSAGAETFTAALSDMLTNMPWQGLKLCSEYHPTFKTCPKELECDIAAEFRDAGNLILCRTMKGSRAPNSAFYALHKSIFRVFLEALQAARAEQTNPITRKAGYSIDRWVPQAVNLHHILPNIANQIHRPLTCDKSLEFRDKCAKHYSGDKGDNPWDPDFLAKEKTKIEEKAKIEEKTKIEDKAKIEDEVVHALLPRLAMTLAPLLAVTGLLVPVFLRRR